MKTLSEEQEAAANSDAPVTCVLASPGSGKTQTLATRIQRRIAAGVDPKRMAVMSFTNAGAKEFSDRLAKLGVPRLGYMGTLHGWCFRLVQKHGDLIGYKAATVSLITAEQSKEMITRIAAKLAPKILKKELNAKPADRKADALLCWREYDRELKLNNVTDYDGVLDAAIQLLGLPEVQKANTIEDLSADEVQDSGDADWAIFIRIPAARKFYIGDSDQSIFGFRGARPALFEDMASHGGRCKELSTFTLEDNYRSASAITDAANALIGHNQRALPKWTRPMREGGHAWVERYATDRDEKREIIDIIQSDEKFAPEDMAVLTRNNALADEIRDELRRAGIPVAEPASVEMPHDWELALATVALMHNPSNDLVGARWLLASGATEAVVAKGRNEAAIEGRCLLANWKGADIRPFLEPVPFGEVTTQLVRRSISRQSVAVVGQRQDLLPPGCDTGDLLRDLWRYREWDRGENGSGVHCGTIHGFKGREAALVIMAGMEEGTLPGRGDIDEERRLAFVGMTRAKEVLYLTWAATRWKYGKSEACVPSRFISESGL